MTVFEKHLAAIESGEINAYNLVGLRKGFNAARRAEARLSISATAPSWAPDPDKVKALEDAIEKHQPRIVGSWKASGLRQLKSPRYSDHIGGSCRRIVEDLEDFRLAYFGYLSESNWHVHAAYRAIARDGDEFTFCNIPWQSGGDGPEILSYGRTR